MLVSQIFHTHLYIDAPTESDAAQISLQCLVWENEHDGESCSEKVLMMYSAAVTD